MPSFVQSLRLARIATGVALLCLVSLTWADDKKDDKAPKGKPNIIEVDLSKLPPDVAKQVLESLKKADVKPLSLTEAIGIAEKASKGEATKAERKGEGTETEFKIDVIVKDGSKLRITLSATGKVLDSEDAPKGKGPPGKGKGPPAGKGKNSPPSKGKEADKKAEDKKP